MPRSPSTTHISENLPLLDSSVSDSEWGVVEDRLVRKVDLRMSVLVLAYILVCIDKTDIASARLRGFEEELHLESSQFATILSAFYIGLVLMKIPSNMLLDGIGKPSIHLPSCIVVWGIISFYTGFAADFYDMLLSRLLLGMVEAALFPGTLYLMSRWYKRSELSLRTAVLFSGYLIGNVVGSLMASGILNSMDGVLGHSAWRWLFFLEGSLAVIIAVVAFFVLPDLPEYKASWLTRSEHALAQQRMKEKTTEVIVVNPTYDNVELDREDGNAGMFAGCRLAFTDPKVWWLCIALFLLNASTSFGLYFPTLSATMGYNATISLLLCSPPWVVGTLSSIWVSRHSDKVGERCMHATIPMCVSVVGFLLAMSTMNVAARYISLFLMTISSSGYTCFFAWAASSVFLFTPKPTTRTPSPVSRSSSSKGAVALASMSASTQIANIVAVYVWPKAWGPTYNKSYAFCTVTMGLTIVMILIFRIWLQRLNKVLDSLECRTLGINECELSEREKGWRYML